MKPIIPLAAQICAFCLISQIALGQNSRTPVNNAVISGSSVVTSGTLTIASGAVLQGATGSTFNANYATTSGTTGAAGLNTYWTSSDSALHNNWTYLVDFSGTGEFLADRLGPTLIISGNNSYPLMDGTSTSSVTSGTTTIITGTTTLVLSGTQFGIANPQGSQRLGGITLTGTGTDDWSAFQALLDTATTAGFVVINQERDICVSKSLRPYSHTTWNGNGHAVHLLGGENMPVISTVLTGGTISSWDIAINDVLFDENGQGQTDAGLTTESSDPWNLQGDGQQYGWVLGAWFGSASGVHLNRCTFMNPPTFNLVYSHLQNSSVTDCNFVCADVANEVPPYSGGDNHHDATHCWGPATNVSFVRPYFLGNDDDSFALLPVEWTTEDTDISGTIESTRRGAGGTIYNVDLVDGVFDNCRSGLRWGGFDGAPTALIDSCHTSVSGTIWSGMNSSNTNYGTNYIDSWNVVSGTGNGLNAIIINEPGDSEFVLNGISDKCQVILYPSNTGDYNTQPIGGSFGNDIRTLRDGLIAAYTFDTDTSGSSAFDWSQNNCILTNDNSVAYGPVMSGTGGYLWGNVAIFSGSSGADYQTLYLSGSNCPNIAGMPEWTIFLTAYCATPTSGNVQGVFAMLSGTSVQLLASVNIQGYEGQLVNIGAWQFNYNSPNFTSGHLEEWCIRKRAPDGYISTMVNLPANAAMGYNSPDLGQAGWKGGLAITGTTTKIELGGCPESGAAELNGWIDNVYLYSRCLTDHQALLLMNQGSDGVTWAEQPGTSLQWSGREWPFDR